MADIRTTPAVPARDASPGAGPAASRAARIDWIDIAKGTCIVMVVLMHTVLGFEKAAGVRTVLHDVVDFATPFRMPDFFLIAGLFLGRSIASPPRAYADAKVLHFVYFYVLWFLIQWALKDAAPALAQRDPLASLPALAAGLWDPPGAMWFIYILPIFLVVLRLAQALPRVLILGIALALNVLHPETGWYIGDQFCDRFVFFCLGFYAAPLVFAVTARVRAYPGRALAILAVWAATNEAAVLAGVPALPGIGFVLGLCGALAVASTAVLLEGRALGRVLRVCGRHSLSIYLAFFLPMAGLRTLWLALGAPLDPALASLAVTAVAVALPIAMARAVRGTPLAFLFERPAWAHLPTASRERPAAAPTVAPLPRPGK